MQFESKAGADARCLHTASDIWLRVVHFVSGPLPIDNTLKESLREIGSTEEELKAELDALIARGYAR